MKIYIFLFISFFLHTDIFSQNISEDIDSTAVNVDSVLAPTKTSIEFKKLDENFQFGNFKFYSNWSNLNFYFDIQNDDDLLNYPYNNLINDYKYIFHYNLKTKFNNIDFDDVFLSINKSIYFSNSELTLYKKFENAIDAQLFFKKMVNLYFNVNKNISNDYFYGEGKKVDINISINDNYVYLKFSDKFKLYKKTLLFSYDYFFLSDGFKEIDNDNTFRGLKFGTQKNIIKSIVKSSKTNFDNVYSLFTNESKYLIWKGISFADGGCGLFFSKDFKFAEVRLGYVCSNDEDYKKFLTKLTEILGPPSNEKFGVSWIGKNITIYIPSEKEKETDLVILYISSNFLNTVKYKDF